MFLYIKHIYSYTLTYILRYINIRVKYSTFVIDGLSGRV